MPNTQKWITTVCLSAIPSSTWDLVRKMLIYLVTQIISWVLFLESNNYIFICSSNDLYIFFFLQDIKSTCIQKSSLKTSTFYCIIKNIFGCYWTFFPPCLRMSWWRNEWLVLQFGTSGLAFNLKNFEFINRLEDFMYPQGYLDFTSVASVENCSFRSVFLKLWCTYILPGSLIKI